MVEISAHANVKVLSIGTTRELWSDPAHLQGDTPERLKSYATAVCDYQVIVHALKRHRLLPLELRPGAWAYPSNGWTHIDSWARMLSIGQELGRTHAFDLVQAQDSFFTGTVGWLLSRRWGVPLNVCVYGANPFDPHWIQERRLYRWGAPLARAILKRAEGIQVDGSMTAKMLSAAGLPPERISIKPMIPVNIDDFFAARPDPELRSELLDHGRFDHVALFIGRLVAQKNLVMLLRTAQALQDINVRWVCIGDGVLRADLERATHQMELADRVMWIGARSHARMPSYLASSDVFVLPSHYEGFARVLIEAAAAGKPIVTTAVSGADDAVANGETGHIVPVGNEEEFAHCVREVLSDARRAAQMGIAGREHIHNVVARYRSSALQIEVWKRLNSRHRGDFKTVANR